jgi:hypothetical protein
MGPTAVTDEPDVEPPPLVAPGVERRRLLALVVVAAVVLAAVVGIDALRSGGRPASPPGRWTLTPHTGLGAWVDAYDWTVLLGGPTPGVGLEEIDAMAEAGVQTVYLQTGHERSDDDVIEPERLDELIDRIHDNDMHVVAWYLPTFVDLERDLRRLEAAAELNVDGLGVDIEAVTVTDPIERNRRVVELSDRLRATVGEDKALAAITLSSVHVDVVNTAFWPGFPWSDLAGSYDAILPMAYWSIRQGELQDGGRYIGENLDRIRAHVGPDVPIHPIGGIADGVTDTDLDGMVAAIEGRGAIGGSLYDWNTSTAEQWAALAPLRDLRR